MIGLVKRFENVEALDGNDLYIYYDDADGGWVLMRVYDEAMNVVDEHEFPEENASFRFDKLVRDEGFPCEIASEMVDWLG